MSSPPGIRTCIGCRRTSHRTTLMRVVLSRQGVDVTAQTGLPAVVLDPTGSAVGRGAWLHPGTECLDRAVKARAFHRAFRTAVRTDRLEEQCFPLREGG